MTRVHRITRRQALKVTAGAVEHDPAAGACSDSRRRWQADDGHLGSLGTGGQSSAEGSGR